MSDLFGSGRGTSGASPPQVPAGAAEPGPPVNSSGVAVRLACGVAARLASVAEQGPTVSFELYPPRSPAAEEALSIGVAATPSALRGRSSAESDDLRALRAKQAAGADYAITQVFFEVEDYRRYLAAARAAGITLPLLPGIVPLADPRRLRRLEEISGVPVPRWILERLDGESDEERRRAAGVAMGVDFVAEVLAAGAPGLHLYTFNQHRAALDLLSAARLR
jgi:methylenetetrahydrofolate reductase (NADPH)